MLQVSATVHGTHSPSLHLLNEIAIIVIFTCHGTTGSHETEEDFQVQRAVWDFLSGFRHAGIGGL